MTDTSTQKPATILYAEGVGPYLKIPYSQVADVERVLTEHGIYYWVREHVFSWNGGPEIATVRFGQAGDRDAIQAAMDTLA